METVYEKAAIAAQKYFDLYNCTDADISNLKTYSYIEKRAVKKQINISIDALVSKIKEVPADKDKQQEWQENLKTELQLHAKNFLNIKNKVFENIMIEGFSNVAEAFIHSARKFDSSLKGNDIYQAIRNVWIMNIIQALANKDVEHTKAVFAYSMLYPYTDNFLDDPVITPEEKKTFNQRLGLRLSNPKILPVTPVEEKIYSLISMIESQYKREDYPQVYDSIICIHNGQCSSISQQDTNTTSVNDDILKISIEKGGASVLADAYLVCGNIDKELFDLVFGFGFILQLVDDLQDAAEDYKNNHITIFSGNLPFKNLDHLASKLISFTTTALDFDSYKKSPYIEDIKNLIIDNTLLLVFEAISQNQKYYSRKYVKNIKKHTPFSYSYIHRKINKAKKELKNLSEFF